MGGAALQIARCASKWGCGAAELADPGAPHAAQSGLIAPVGSEGGRARGACDPCWAFRLGGRARAGLHIRHASPSTPGRASGRKGVAEQRERERHAQTCRHTGQEPPIFSPPAHQTTHRKSDRDVCATRMRACAKRAALRPPTSAEIRPGGGSFAAPRDIDCNSRRGVCARSARLRLDVLAHTGPPTAKPSVPISGRFCPRTVAMASSPGWAFSCAVPPGGRPCRGARFFAADLAKPGFQRFARRYCVLGFRCSKLCDAGRSQPAIPRLRGHMGRVRPGDRHMENEGGVAACGDAPVSRKTRGSSPLLPRETHLVYIVS